MCTTALRNKKITVKFSINTSPYFHSVLIVLWLLTLLHRGHFGELAVTKKAMHEMHFESKARHLMRVWLYFFIPKNGRKYSHTNSYIFAISPVKIPKDVRWLFQDCLFVGDVVTLKLSILPRKQEVKIIMVINQIFYISLTFILSNKLRIFYHCRNSALVVAMALNLLVNKFPTSGKHWILFTLPSSKLLS